MRLRIGGDGYAWVKADSNEFTKCGGWVHEHHWNWFKKFKQKVPGGCVLHHINFNKLDNRVSNLCLVTRAAHTRIHKIWKAISAEGRARQREAVRQAWKDGRYAKRAPRSAPTVATKEKLSLAGKKAWAAGKMEHPDTAAKKSAAQKKYWGSAEGSAQRSEIMKRAHARKKASGGWSGGKHLRNGIEVA